MSQHHSELMATLSENGLSPVTGQQQSYSNNGVTNSGSNKSEPMCDDLATSTATYTTLQSSSANSNTHNGHYGQQTSANQQNSMAPNNSSSSQGASKGVKRSAPSTTATKSTYSNGSKANSAANGTTASATGTTGNSTATSGGRGSAGGGKKTKGRVKIKMEFIDNKLRRYTTFSKRKTGIMKKVGDIFTLTLFAFWAVGMKMVGVYF